MAKREKFDSFMSPDVLCPFYIGDNSKNKIRCEGVVGATSTFYFGRGTEGKAGMLAHAQKLCCNEYEKCPAYAAINELYEEGKR